MLKKILLIIPAIITSLIALSGIRSLIAGFFNLFAEPVTTYSLTYNITRIVIEIAFISGAILLWKASFKKKNNNNRIRF